jgi:hypothetical protein
MAVGFRFSWPENTIDDYEKVRAALNFPADWPDGLLSHGCREVDGGGIAIREVWESHDHWARFMQDRLQNTIASALGDRAREPAEVQEQELYSYYTHG